MDPATSTSQAVERLNLSKYSVFNMESMEQEIPDIRVVDELCRPRRMFTGNALKTLDKDASARDAANLLTKRLCKQTTAERGSFKAVNLDLGFEEAASRRLKEGTNHKRALSDVDLDSFKQLQLHFTECNKQPELYRHHRPHSDETGTGEGPRRRSLSPLGRNARLIIEHEASAMPGRSPGKRKRHQHSEDLTRVEDLTDDVESSPTITHEAGGGSPDSYENEGEVISVKRIKPNTAQKLKQHSSEAEPLGHAGLEDPKFGQVWRLTGSREEQRASADRNARNQADTHESKDAPKKQASIWEINARARYNSDSNPLADYGPPPGIRIPKATGANGTMKPQVPGGPKPVNRLGNPQSNPNTASKLQRPPPKTKAFDLHHEEAFSKPAAHNPNKRQRISNGSSASNGSATPVIDLVDEPRDNRRHGGPPTNRSGQSQSQAAQHRKDSFGNRGVEEYRTVEDWVNPRRRPTRQSMVGQNSGGGGSNRFLSKDAQGKKRSVVRLDDSNDREDPDDPIVSDSDEFPQNQPVTDSSPQVIVEPYKGTAFLNVKVNRYPKASMKETEHTSRFFNPAQDREQKPRSTQSELENKSGPNGGLVRVTRQRGGKSEEPKLSTSIGSYEDPMSLDEISSEHFEKELEEKQMARRLVDELEKSRLSSAKSTRRELRNRPSQEDNSSEEDILAKKADIKHTDFGNSKKVKRKKIPGEVWYDLVQIFSATNKWLVGSSKVSWSLLHDSNSGKLIAHDCNDTVMVGFLTKSIEKIEICGQGGTSGKMVIHKSRNMNAGDSTQVFLELKNADQSIPLAERIKASDKVLGLLPKTESYLDRVFAYNRNKRPEPTAKKRQPVEEEPLDIKLAKAKQARKFANDSRRLSDPADVKSAKATQAKFANDSRRLIDQFENGDTASRLEPRGGTRTRRTRSSSDLSEFDDMRSAQLARRPSAIESKVFYDNDTHSKTTSYGTRSSTRVTGKESISRQPPKPRSPSPDRWTQVNPNWAKDWKASIIYPREGKDRATVDKQDIERLNEGEFLNDNLIIFYLHWLEHRLRQDKPDLAKRIYFHNTFFYERLTKAVRGKKGINYEAVERWTAKVDLLSYDYIIVPVNEHTHWYVAIICNAPKLLIAPSDPEAMVIEDSQSREKEKGPEEAKIAVDTTAKSSQSSPSSPKATSMILSDPAVSNGMEEMSLDDKPSEERPKNELSNDQLPNDTLQTIDAADVLATEADGSVGNDGADEYDIEVKEAVTRMTSDLVQPASKKSTPAKKGKRKSVTPAPRKYDPTEPRIITLDSLGLKHSPTCTNLKEYLIAEIKSKLGLDIPPPGSLGMTATQIPQQDNLCDCGLFLLSYIEKFLEKPDEFVFSILQSQVVDLEIQWPKASDMRIKIRHLLLNLQKEQAAENERLQRGKTKMKKASKGDSKSASNADSKAPPTIYPKPESRETSKSARNSPGPERSAVEHPTPQPETESKHSTIEQPKNPEPPKRKREPSGDIYAMPEDAEKKSAVEKECGSTITSFVSSFRHQISKTFGGQGKDESQRKQTRPGKSKFDALEILESPEKTQETNHPSPASPSRPNGTSLKSPSPEQEETPHTIRRDRHPTPYPDVVARTPSPRPGSEKRHNGIAQSLPSDDIEDPVRQISSGGRPDVIMAESNHETPHEEQDPMLFPNEDSQDGEVPPPPPMISSSAPSTPDFEHRDHRQIKTDTPSSRKRRSIIEITDDEDSRHRMPERDGLDRALMGKHIRF